jgi:hypothetical protein
LYVYKSFTEKVLRSVEKVFGDVGSLGEESLRIAVVGLGKMGLLHASILNVLRCEKSV